ncbi:MAG: helicase-associated domain-containing protein [Leptospirales bacterium]|nr:helicase-associated domain-containing protein [Leptospirales bacterium]
MKPIAESIKKLTQTQRGALARFLNCAHASEKELTKAVLSASGINSILKSLSQPERELLRAVYANGDGQNLGHFAKQLNNIDISEIEKMAASLARNLLVCILMDRQRLTNRLDKIYAIEELAPHIETEAENIADKARKLRVCMEEKKSDESLVKKIDSSSEKIIAALAGNGGIMFLDSITSIMDSNELNLTIERAAENNLISVRYSLVPDFSPYIIINEKLLPLVCGKKKYGKGRNIGNGYRFIINMLYAYDSISSYGLFLTKQMVFRKVDYNRIVNSMIPINDRNGEIINSEKICAAALFFLASLKCLSLNKDSVGTNISQIKESLETPHTLISRILSEIDPAKNTGIFACPDTMSPYKMTGLAIRILHSVGTTQYGYLKTLLLTAIVDAERKKLPETISNISEKKKEIDACLDLLCILGVINIQDGNYSLSDAGYDTAFHLFKLKVPDETAADEKKIYINPDFSLILPVQEISSICAYRIMIWSEIIKDDIILNAQISRSSIVTAQKRGLSPESFMKTLQEHSKNGIPQNMEFQLNEWSKQTLKITINESVLLKSNRNDFFEEILYAKNLADAIEVINNTYAIVNRRHLDEIIKLAAKRNAVISLFEE